MKFKYYFRNNKKNVQIKNVYLIIIIYCFIYIQFNSNFVILISQKEEFINIEKYLKYCNDSKISELQFSKAIKFPKVSIISPIYNRGEYILRFLKSIQNQYFRDIEIILIDDFSSDDTLNLINQYQSIDKRIIIIKNKKNFGTFKSRNLGILKSKGEYVILPDPDDILSQSSLHMFYFFAKNHDYEMLRFNLYIGKKKIFFSNCANPTPSKPIYKPIIKTFLFYATGRLRQIDFNVSNKFIKREALIRALNSLSREYLNMYMTNFEDGVLNYFLYRNVRSFYFYKRIGYYYIRNPYCITGKGFNSNTIKFIFIHLKLVFEFSENTPFEKNMFNVLFRRLVIRKLIKKRIKLMKADVKFYIDSIDLFLENEFVSINNKRYMIRLKESLMKIH